MRINCENHDFLICVTFEVKLRHISVRNVTALT